MKLIIGNKKYSSWSLRPWIAMTVKGIEFEEELSKFDHSTTPYHKHFWDFSPTKMVPVLKVNDATIWDSLAILEYLAECFPEHEFWPRDKMARAHARAVSSEMHSGFFALRNECPMNMARPSKAIQVSSECRADIARIEALFSDCYDLYGGPFLFGEFCIADAMYAPVVNRMRTYQLSDHPAATRFCEAIEALTAWQDWQAAGQAEPWVCEIAEVA